MKKILCLTLAAIFITLILCSCGNITDSNNNQYNNVKIKIFHHSYDETLETIVNEWITNNSNVIIIDIIFINADAGNMYSSRATLKAIIIYQE